MISQSKSQEIEDPCIRLKASSFFGVDKDELTHLLEVMSSVCDEYGVQFDHTTSDICLTSQPSTSIPGSLGRAIMIDVHGAVDVNIEESDFITELKNGISQQIDDYIYSGQLSQPVLLAFQSATANSVSLSDIIEKEVLDYGLRDGINRDTTQSNHDDASFLVDDDHKGNSSAVFAFHHFKSLQHHVAREFISLCTNE